MRVANDRFVTDTKKCAKFFNHNPGAGNVCIAGLSISFFDLFVECFTRSSHLALPTTIAALKSMLK